MFLLALFYGAGGWEGGFTIEGQMGRGMGGGGAQVSSLENHSGEFN